MLFLADIISIVHSLLGIFIYSGFILLPEKYLPHYIIFIILIHIHWKFNDDKCILTVWENNIRNVNSVKAGYENITYVTRFLSYFYIYIDDDTSVLLVVWSQRMLCVFALIRYLNYINNKNIHETKLITFM